MKKAYTKPMIQFERYSMDQAIASNCKIVVSNGPGDEVMGYPQCDDYVKDNPFDSFSLQIRPMAVYNVQFYEHNCDCYYSAGDGYWQS